MGPAPESVGTTAGGFVTPPPVPGVGFDATGGDVGTVPGGFETPGVDPGPGMLPPSKPPPMMVPPSPGLLPPGPGIIPVSKPPGVVGVAFGFEATGGFVPPVPAGLVGVTAGADGSPAIGPVGFVVLGVLDTIGGLVPPVVGGVVPPTPVPDPVLGSGMKPPAAPPPESSGGGM